MTDPLEMPPVAHGQRAAATYKPYPTYEDVWCAWCEKLRNEEVYAPFYIKGQCVNANQVPFFACDEHVKIVRRDSTGCAICGEPYKIQYVMLAGTALHNIYGLNNPHPRRPE